MEVPPAVFINSCPNCGLDVSSERLAKGGVCERCLDEELEFNSVYDLAKKLHEKGALKNLRDVLELHREFSKVERLFKEALGYPPLGPQRSWVLRVLRGESFAIIAPPGLGKTTFGLLMSLYFSSKKKRTIGIFPTRTIVAQSVSRLQDLSTKLELTPRIIYYHAGLTQGEKKEVLSSLESNDFDIFLTTSRFVIDNLDTLKRVDYNFLFVDDVDTALKSSKSAKSILQLSGFSEDDIEKARELLRQARKDESAFRKIAELRQGKLEGKVVVFSSATITKGNPVMSALMGFRPGSAVIYLRNVVDTYLKMPESEDEAKSLFVKIVKKLGDGVLVFVPVDKGQEKGKELVDLLNEEGISAEFISSESVTKLEGFTRGEINVLVGSAIHYGLLVRGIDIPWRVKYAVFYGIPKFKFRIGDVVPLLLMSRILTIVANLTKDNELVRLAGRVRAKVRNLSPAAVAMISQQVREGKLEDEVLLKGYEVVNKALSDEQTLKKVAELGDLVIKDRSLLAPDYLTYIQASGRTSRIYAGSLTTGLSVLMVDDDDLFRLLNKKLNLVLEEVNWYPFDIESFRIGDKDARETIKKIEEERREIAENRKSGTEPQLNKIKTVTFIVESPTKAKMISSFFARPSVRDMDGLRIYETVIEGGVLNVVATQGHVYDLTTKDISYYGVEVKKTDGKTLYIPYYNTIKRCANGHQVTETDEKGNCPKCGAPIVLDKAKTVEALRKLVMESDLVLIGTDPDTEGEKIAWDLYMVLRPFNPNIKRAEFHEVTRKAIMNALNNPRDFNVNLVKAQIVRRIEDRWIGFSLSKKLQTDFWRDYCSKAKLDQKGYSCSENKNLSAGRVQTPVLGWVIGRYEDYNKSKRRVYLATVPNIEGFSVQVVRDKDKGITKSSQLTIVFLEYTEGEKEQNPLPPYTTDTLLSDATQMFKMTASEVMKIAQDLFESGLITYHRTDSTRISATGIGVAESYLKNSLGDSYKEVFRPRTWGEGGAHEAIRPTRPLDVEGLRLAIEEAEIEPPKELTRGHFAVYDLIFRRFITSQLVPLKLKIEKIKFKVLDEDGNEVKVESDEEERVVGFELNGIPQEKAWSMVYTPFRLQKPVVPILKDVCAGSKECDFPLKIERSFIKSDVRLYTEGELVAEMKKREIGRPSTYATIISTLRKRAYIIETKTMKMLVPTQLGSEVYKYLSANFSTLISEDRTRKLLKEMDEVENGTREYTEVLNEIYNETKNVK